MLTSDVNNIVEISTGEDGNTIFVEEAAAPINPKYNGARFFYRKIFNGYYKGYETYDYATFAYKYDDLNQCLKVAVAYCSKKDRFVRATGRSLSLLRLDSISDYASIPYKLISSSHDTPKIKDIIKFLIFFPEPSK